MVQESTGFGFALFLVIIGTGALLYGEAVGIENFVPIGGVIALVGIGIMAWLISNIPHPTDQH